MVLDVKGQVEVKPAEGKPERVVIGYLLYPGERLVVPVDGAATLAILRVGAQEQIKPGSEATVGPQGCSPPGAVAARKEQARAVATTMRIVEPLPDNSRMAGKVLRDIPVNPPAITPIFGATVTSDRPSLAWPTGKEAKGYQVKLLSSAGGELWRGETKETHVVFPEGKEALQRGYVYRWEVTDEEFRPVASGEFSVATQSELKQMEDLRSLAEGGDRADQLAAALAYQRLGAYTEALAMLECLAKEAPEESLYRRVLAELYRLAGRPEAAGGKASK